MNLVSTDGDVADVLTVQQAARRAVRSGDLLLASIVEGAATLPSASAAVAGSPDELHTLQALADKGAAAATGRRAVQEERGRCRAARRDAGRALRVQIRTIAGVVVLLAALVWS